MKHCERPQSSTCAPAHHPWRRDPCDVAGEARAATEAVHRRSIAAPSARLVGFRSVRRRQPAAWSACNGAFSRSANSSQVGVSRSQRLRPRRSAARCSVGEIDRSCANRGRLRASTPEGASPIACSQMRPRSGRRSAPPRISVSGRAESESVEPRPPAASVVVRVRPLYRLPISTSMIRALRRRSMGGLVMRPSGGMLA